MKLIKAIKEVMQVIPVPMTSEIEVIKPFLSMAERNIIQIISRAQFDALVTAYDADTTDETLKQAIEFAQRVIVNLGYHYAIPVLSVKISSAGILLNSGENTKQAFNWQVGNLERSLLELGFAAIEDLLELLESDSAKFSSYHASDEFKKQKQYLISSAASFSEYYNIGGSRYVFQSLSYIMKRIEEQHVKPTFGSEFFELLKHPADTNPLTPSSRVLINNYLMPGIALLTAAKALRERIITFENGVATINLKGNYDAAKVEMPADKEQVNAAFNQLTEDGNKYLEDGLAFIIENITDFPGYVVPKSKKRFNIVNDRNKGIWAH